MGDLTSLLQAAASHRMTPDEIRAQRISFIVGQTGLTREQVSEWLDRHYGRPTPSPSGREGSDV